MNDLTGLPDGLLDPLDHVVAEATDLVPDLQPHDVMVVGAVCRDLHHHALGHRFAAAATHDLDLALALPSWDVFGRLAEAFPRIGDTGIRFRIADTAVDLIPFGGIEDPDGITDPPTRRESVSVWAFKEIFESALPLALPSGAAVRSPTVAGYAAAKVGAWLDRSEWYEVKDAADLALTLYWYGESAAVHDRLYETDEGNAALIGESVDLPRAAARLLGADIASTIGTTRTGEMLTRWPGDRELFARELALRGAGWTQDVARRHELIEALERGFAAH